MTFPCVAIVGMGQIGGSLGMALLRRRLTRCVIGIDRDARALRKARARGACTETSRDLRASARADLVVLAVPVRAILALAPRAARLLRPGALLTDTGSTKAAVARAFRPFPGAVPGHPMCGTEKPGIDAADPEIFRGAPWVLTRRAPRLEHLVRALGARPVLMTSAAHDREAALVSHLPYAVALWLSRRAGPDPPLAAGSFRSATRVAAQPAAMGADILLTNPFPLARELETMAAGLRRLASALRRGNVAAVKRFVKEGCR
ncbi:MAG: prephenate dehydrogenase [Planctomycetes bacterium]|nr:prephenate dehydrogenase [Planctomycetota bacterium]